MSPRQQILSTICLTKLQPGKRYYYAIETAGLNGKPVQHGAFTGSFVTAPTPDAAEALRFLRHDLPGLS